MEFTFSLLLSLEADLTSLQLKQSKECKKNAKSSLVKLNDDFISINMPIISNIINCNSIKISEWKSVGN